MSDNLYQQTVNSSLNSAAPQTATTTNSGILALFNLDLAAILYWLNLFTLAWCIFYSIILISNFYYFWVNFADGEVENEQKGAKAISDAAWMWWSYLSAVILYIVFKNSPAEYASFTGWFAVVFFVCKIIVFDLPDIPFLSIFLGKPGDLITKSVGDLSSGVLKGIGGVSNSLFGIGGEPTPPPKK